MSSGWTRLFRFRLGQPCLSLFRSFLHTVMCVSHKEQGRWFVRVWNRITGSIYGLWLMDYLTLSVNPFLNTAGVYKKQRLHNIYRLILLRTSLRMNIVQLHARYILDLENHLHNQTQDDQDDNIIIMFQSITRAACKIIIKGTLSWTTLKRDE